MIFYSTASKENCVELLSAFFENLSESECVQASIGMSEECEYVDHGFMQQTLEHLQSARCWKRVTGWGDGVEYTILDPNGNVTARDVDPMGSPTLTRKSTEKKTSSRCDRNPIFLKIRRTREVSADGSLFNSTQYSHVKIMSSKSFFYETGTSSWVFKLSVIWEGATRDIAEGSSRKFAICVHSGDSEKSSRNPGYTSASFLEKIIDVASICSAGNAGNAGSAVNRQTLLFDDLGCERACDNDENDENDTNNSEDYLPF